MNKDKSEFYIVTNNDGRELFLAYVDTDVTRVYSLIWKYRRFEYNEELTHDFYQNTILVWRPVGRTRVIEILKTGSLTPIPRQRDDDSLMTLMKNRLPKSKDSLTISSMIRSKK